MEQSKPSYFKKHPLVKDLLGLLVFAIGVFVGAIILNTYVYRSYNVVGKSMENTLHDEDRVLVNRFAVTWAHFLGEEYVPKRGQVIVFANGSATGPLTCNPPATQKDQYIIKRVIAFPGERVTVKDGVLTVYNDEFPDGFHPDEDTYVDDNNGPKKDVSGDVDTIVPQGELFVAGDNREGTHSFDSRSGLGTVPFCRVIGPVIFRMYPFDKIRTF